MVRLKAYDASEYLLVDPGFNSTMVRLKALLQVDMGFYLRSFNSTMVRLKAYSHRRTTVEDDGFNSTMVRLKDGLCLIPDRGLLGFNSTMVRLKGPIFETSLIHIPSFQFHNGSIKSPDFIIPKPHEYCKKKMKNDGFDRQPPVMQNP